MERAEADVERQRYVDEADEPNRKRSRKTFEEVLIEKRQNHEIEMENRRLLIEEKRLEIESRREDRLLEESRRRDELLQTQINIQKEMLEIMKSIINQKN